MCRGASVVGGASRVAPGSWIADCEGIWRGAERGAQWAKVLVSPLEFGGMQWEWKVVVACSSLKLEIAGGKTSAVTFFWAGSRE
jgi:hypothetical protein